MTVRVFVLDDHELVRRGIRDLLLSQDDLIVVGEATNAEEALERIPQTKPDVAILDLELRDDPSTMAGIEACRTIRTNHPEVPCVILTSAADKDASLTSVMTEASAFVFKEAHGTDLLEAVRRVAAGESSLHPSWLATTSDPADDEPGQTSDPLSTLTPQERRILEFIAEGRTNRQIGDAMFLAEKTVKNYVSNLLAKLGMERRTQAAAFAARLEERNLHHRP